MSNKKPGKKVRITLVPPVRKGKIDPKVIKAAVKRVRDQRHKVVMAG